MIMADSIIPANLPGTYPAYLGYVDGDWPTAPVLRKAHPSARLVTLTVKGGDAQGHIVVADGCDCENGDLTPAQAAQWARQRLAAGAWRPVIYASASAMADVLAELGKLGITRGQVRLLSAHYGKGEHICGPDVKNCGYPAADGTQWTNTAPGLNGSVIDLSILSDEFFGTVATMDAIPLDILGVYTDGNGTVYVIGINADGVLHESKRIAPGKWSAIYQVAGKVGA